MKLPNHFHVKIIIEDSKKVLYGTEQNKHRCKTDNIPTKTAGKTSF